jgi:biofilm PGA synthesis N-glycosyltransferase PgaC
MVVALEIASQPRAEEMLSAQTDRYLRPTQDGFHAPPLGCSVGIMAYNEESNVANAIKAVLGQQLVSGEIGELIVVASGCTDRTVDIVASLAGEDPRVRLVVQERRAGKASAINLFIDAARFPVLLMVNADTLVRPGSIEALVQHFRDPAVGMAGGHAIPVNHNDTFLGFAVHLLWHLHDQIARESPKLGEIVAFRNSVPCIPTDTAVDELSIQALFTQLGYRLVYEPQAIVYNRGPTTVRDFLLQRRRICAGHLQIARKQGYVASTMSVRRIGRALVRSVSLRAPLALLWAAGTVGLEATARGLGYYDFLRRRPHHIWATATTTKGDITEGPDAHGDQNVLVFHLGRSVEDRPKVGAYATRSLLKSVARHVVACLGSAATVSVQKNGTVVAILSCPRRDAEESARLLMRGLSAPSFANSRRDGQPMQITCGIITFPTSGHPLARSISLLAS